MKNTTKLITTYYQAEIFHSVETYIDNDPNKGIDPDSFSESGLIETYTAKTIEQLAIKIKSAYGNIHHVEKGQFETSYAGIERNGTHIVNSISIYVCKIDERELTIKEAVLML